MLKKISSLLLAILLILSFAGCSSNQERALYVPSFADTKLTIGEPLAAPVNNSSGVPMAPEYENLIKESGDYKYVSFTYMSEDESQINLYALPESELNALMESTKVDDTIRSVVGDKVFLKEKDTLKRVEDNAVLIFKHLTQDEGLITNEPVLGECTYLTFNNEEWESSAFGDMFGGEFTATEHFEKEGLKLIFDEPVVKKVIYNEKIGTLCDACAVVVEAEVFCVKNSGCYKKTSWIPGKGKSKTMDFIVTFWSYKNFEDQHFISVNDIAVINDKSGGFLSFLK